MTFDVPDPAPPRVAQAELSEKRPAFTPAFTTTSAAVSPPTPSVAPQPMLSAPPPPITTIERGRRMTATTALPRESGREPGLLELAAIGIGSFLAVFGAGWLLLSYL